MITDFHSHIIPSLDDGASDAETAIEMLKISRRMGVERVVSTSHCYPCEASDIDKFIEERDASYKKLMEAATSEGTEIPEIKLGCEVHLTCDLTRFKNINKLCIGDTNYMLVEMSSSKWTDNTIDNIYKLSVNGIKPIIAHAERNLRQPEELIEALYMLDVLIQINSESFGLPALKKFTDRMMKNKMIHLIGSDMHNLGKRGPTMDKALKYINKRFGAECIEYLMHNADTILKGEEISYRNLRSFTKKSFFGK